MDTAHYMRNLGQVFHYIADYFTYPHNSHFPGNIKDHCVYEERLKHVLRAYIRDGEAVFHADNTRMMRSADEILDYIREEHEAYMSAPRCVEDDCAYITRVSSQVLAALPQFAAVPVMAYAG